MLPGPILYYGPGFFIWALLAASSRPCRKKGGADCLDPSAKVLSHRKRFLFSRAEGS